MRRWAQGTGEITNDVNLDTGRLESLAQPDEPQNGCLLMRTRPEKDAISHNPNVVGFRSLPCSALGTSCFANHQPRLLRIRPSQAQQGEH